MYVIVSCYEYFTLPFLSELINKSLIVFIQVSRWPIYITEYKRFLPFRSIGISMNCVSHIVDFT